MQKLRSPLLDPGLPLFTPGVGQNTALFALHAVGNEAMLMSVFPTHSILFFPTIFKHQMPQVMKSKPKFYLWFDEFVLR